LSLSPTLFMYKAAFVLFLVLFYFRTDLDHSFGSMLEVIMFGLVGLALFLDLAICLKRVKERISKFRSERVSE
jgi:uncharacterized membrane protein YhaH (DUF805 family)